MTDKVSLTFYTNIPTPYQRSFFTELSRHFKLKVVYYSITESNRSWKFTPDKDYEAIVLENNAIGRFVQRWMKDFHFSWSIFSVAWKDSSTYVIVGGNYWIPNATVALLFSRLKARKVAYFSEPLFEVKNKLKFYIKWAYLRILNLCCDAIFCVGKRAAETFSFYQVHTPKYIIPYNINVDAYHNLDQQKLEDMRNRYKSNDEIIIISSGELIRRKGMDVLINAVKGISYPNLKLVIIGDGAQKEELIRLCGQDDRIHLEGFKHPSDIPYYYAIADIFALASRYDGWAVVINEAIAANVPIVCSDRVGAAVDLITTPDLGILCESENVAGFREAIASLIQDKEKRDRIKKNAASLIPLISSGYNASYVRDIFTQHLK